MWNDKPFSQCFSVCGGITFLQSGMYEIKSPFYPKPYPSKKMCMWHIKARAEAVLALRFLRFDVEPHPTCAYDMLRMYDGKTMSSPLLANYCGNRTPLPVITTDQNLMVLFETDGDGDFRGFKAIVHVITHGKETESFSLVYIFINVFQIAKIIIQKLQSLCLCFLPSHIHMQALSHAHQGFPLGCDMVENLTQVSGGENLS